MSFPADVTKRLIQERRAYPLMYFKGKQGHSRKWAKWLELLPTSSNQPNFYPVDSSYIKNTHFAPEQTDQVTGEGYLTD